MSESKLKLLRKQLKFLDLEIQKLIEEEEDSICPSCKRCPNGKRKRCRSSKTKKLLKGHYYGRRCPNKSRKTCSKQKGGGDIVECPIVSKEEEQHALEIMKFLQNQTGGGNLDYDKYTNSQRRVANIMGIFAGMIVGGIAPITIVSLLYKWGFGDVLLTVYKFLTSGYDFANYGCEKGSTRLLRSTAKFFTGAPSCADIALTLENSIISALKTTAASGIGLAGSWYSGYLSYAWSKPARLAYNAVYDLTLRKFYGCYEKPFDKDTEELAGRAKLRKKREREEDEAFEAVSRYRQDGERDE